MLWALSALRNVTPKGLRRMSDHRDIGKAQELFIFSKHSPGSCIFLPNGAIIYNKLVSLIKHLHHKFGYEEVITPNLFNQPLWEISGHWDLYKDNMFRLDVDGAHFGLKPMNCPGHWLGVFSPSLIFSHRPRSYRELPLRLAEFGVVHRDEPSGGLSGLTRVRRFQQDDAHIFCERDQVSAGSFRSRGRLGIVSTSVGLSMTSLALRSGLSSRPARTGTSGICTRGTRLRGYRSWSMRQLSDALVSFGADFTVSEGDGAFYGPKIDMLIEDSLGRSHQCGTVQLDFHLPERFALAYLNRNQECERPVIIHRAILGSFERIFAILCETYEGRWPFWISPFQCAVLSVGESANAYAEAVWGRLRAEGFACSLDVSASTRLGKKVRSGVIKYNYVAVVGEAERETGTVDLREDGRRETLGVEDLVTRFHSMSDLKYL